MKEHWLIEGINEWKQLRGKYNWYTATVIDIEFERELLAYGYEFQFILLGLGFRIRYNTDKSNETFEKWDREAKDLVELYSDTWTDLKDK